MSKKITLLMKRKKQFPKRKPNFLLILLLSLFPASMALALLAESDFFQAKLDGELLDEEEDKATSTTSIYPLGEGKKIDVGSDCVCDEDSVAYTTCPESWSKNPKIVLEVKDCECRNWWGGKANEEIRGEKVLCSELYHQGLLDEKIYEADSEYAKRIHPIVVMGYHFWAKPLVRVMRRSKLVVKILKPFIETWAFHMGWKMGVVKQDNLLGKILEGVGIPFCFLLGSLVNFSRILYAKNN